jgi:hypothetical protein
MPQKMEEEDEDRDHGYVGAPNATRLTWRGRDDFQVSSSRAPVTPN